MALNFWSIGYPQEQVYTVLQTQFPGDMMNISVEIIYQDLGMQSVQNAFHIIVFLHTVDSCYLEFEGTIKTLRDICTSTYQICSMEEKIFEQLNFTNDYVI